MLTIMSNLLPGIQRPARKDSIWVPWIICAVVVLLVGAGIVWMIVSTSSEDDYDSNTSYEAIAQCEAAIKEKLKAPSTAEFESTATGGGTWTVVGTVDAENSFGAMLRSSYQCSVIIDNVEDTARVRIDSFE